MSILLEEVGVVGVAEERHSVGEHPDVAASTVVVGLAPLAVFITYTQDLVRYPVCVGSLVVRVRVEAWKKKARCCFHCIKTVYKLQPQSSVFIN